MRERTTRDHAILTLVVVLLLVGALLDATRTTMVMPLHWLGHFFAALLVVAAARRSAGGANPFDRSLIVARPIPGWAHWSKVGLLALVGLCVAVGLEIVIARRFLESAQIGAHLEVIDRLRIVEVIVISPLLEEIVYRLGLCGILASVFGSRVGIVGSGLAFGAVHLLRGNLDAANLFAGFFLAWVFLSSRSLGVPVLFHACGNLLAAILQFFWAMHLGFPVMQALSSWSYRVPPR